MNAIRTYIIVTIIVLGAASAWTVFKETAPQQNTTLVETQEDAGSIDTSTWKTYTGDAFGFSIMRPHNMRVRELEIPGEPPLVVFSLTGPTQTENTELFDGITIEVSRNDLGSHTIKEIAQNELAGQSDIAEKVLNTGQEITLAGKNAYMYEIVTIVRYRYYYIPVSDSSYLRLVVFAEDPTHAGFEDTVQHMLSSIVVN